MYEIRTTTPGTDYPGCSRRDATCATREEAEEAVASLVATGEWQEDDLEIVEVVLLPAQVSAALSAGAQPLRCGRLGVTYSGETEDAAQAACEALVTDIAAATGTVVDVTRSGPDGRSGFWSRLSFDGREADATGVAREARRGDPRCARS
jgi:hypothetical protein